MSETPSAQQTVAPKEQDALRNAVKLGGEAFVVPGTSQLLDGHVISGAAHAVVGVAARALLGPVGWVGWLLVGANSYSSSVTNQNLLQLGQAAARGAARGIQEGSQGAVAGARGAAAGAAQGFHEASVRPPTEDVSAGPSTADVPETTTGPLA